MRRFYLAENIRRPYIGMWLLWADKPLKCRPLRSHEKHLLVDYDQHRHRSAAPFVHSQQIIMVVGRLRISYEDGFWDEWYAIDLDNGTGIWIQEDDGQLVALSPVRSYLLARF